MPEQGRLRFFNLVKQMRAAQKEYFAHRTQKSLFESKRLEKLVDQYITYGDQYIESKKPKQENLFGK